MSAWKEWRDAEPVEHGGRDEWGACCWWQNTRLCRCATQDEPALATTPTHLPPREHIPRWEQRK